jgi:hypothetical protein
MREEKVPDFRRNRSDPGRLFRERCPLTDVVHPGVDAVHVRYPGAYMLRTLVRSFVLVAILAGPALAAGDRPADTTSQVEARKAKKRSPRKAKKAARKSHKKKVRKARKAKKAARAAKPARAKASADRRPT